MTTVRIVDSIMGSGKTTGAINMMNSDKLDDYGDGNHYIFITPYLDEVKRVREQCDNRVFYEPKIHQVRGEFFTKFDSLHKLLAEGRDIASTHALFKRANDETRELIHAGNYTLILDEVMDVVEQLEFGKHDIELLFNQGLISVDEEGFVHWNDDKRDYDTRYNDIRDMAINHTLIYFRNTILMWTFPVDIFRSFKQVYILTYLFNGQIQRYYYDMFNVKYEMYHAVQRNGVYVFEPKPDNADVDTKSHLRELITIYDGKLNDIGDPDYTLSSTWYDKRSSTGIKQLKNNLYNYFRNITHSKSDEAMWTTFLEHKSKLKGVGFTKGFVSCTLRATNKHRQRCNLAYAINWFMQPIISGFFQDKGVKIDEDTYALSEMLQWIWRSAIRDNKPITLYVPSKRMRTLLIKWLNGDI